MQSPMRQVSCYGRPRPVYPAWHDYFTDHGGEEGRPDVEEEIDTAQLAECRVHIHRAIDEEIERLAEYEVISDRGYEQPGRIPVVNGVLDRRLGISDKFNACETCGMRMTDCPGHFGFIKLELPVLHIGYLKQTVAVLQCICKTCSRILLPPKERLKFRKAFMHPITMVDTVRRSGVFKKVCAYACSMCMCICMKQGRRAAR